MKHRRGFTLLEVLIALAMLAIALTAASRSVGFAAREAAALSDRHVAQWVAQNHLAELRMRGTFPEPSTSNGELGMAGRTLRWEEVVKATDNPLFRRVEVSVFDEQGSRLARLIGFVSRAGT